MPAEFARVRSAFFDAPGVERFVDRKTRKVMSKFGAYVRRAAQTSMRPGKQPSPPGQPPRARGKKLLRRFLFFGFSDANKSVVVGPLRLGRTADQHVPRTLEEGGVIRRERAGRVKSERYRARPFMKPAFDKNVGWVASEYAKA